MADPEHVAILKQGVDVWNAWRSENPDIIPDLHHLDFVHELRGMAAFKDPRSESERIRLLDLPEWVNREGVLDGIDLSRTNLWGARLMACRCARASFREADLWGADLTDVDIWGADITGAVFRQANLTDARIAEVRYDRKQMLGRFFGIRGAATCHGNPILRRDILDQEYIDAHFRRTRFYAGLSWKHMRKLPGYADHPSMFGRIPRMRWRELPQLALPKLLFEMWRLTDYGRSLLSVLLFSVLIIFLFGLGFSIGIETGAVAYLPHAGVDNAFRPFYAAAIGFSTLGLTDLLVAKTLIGQVLIIGNVLSGFTSLGLLLAVFGNKFARRA